MMAQRRHRLQAQRHHPLGVAASSAMIAAIVEMTTLAGATSPPRIAKNAMESSIPVPLRLRALVALHLLRQCHRLQRQLPHRHLFLGAAASSAMTAVTVERTTPAGAISLPQIAKIALGSSIPAPLRLRAMVPLHLRRQCLRLQRQLPHRHCQRLRSLRFFATHTRRHHRGARMATSAPIAAALPASALELEWPGEQCSDRAAFYPPPRSTCHWFWLHWESAVTVQMPEGNHIGRTLSKAADLKVAHHNFERNSLQACSIDAACYHFCSFARGADHSFGRLARAH